MSALAQLLHLQQRLVHLQLKMESQEKGSSGAATAEVVSIGLEGERVGGDLSQTQNEGKDVATDGEKGETEEGDGDWGFGGSAGDRSYDLEILSLLTKLTDLVRA